MENESKRGVIMSVDIDFLKIVQSSDDYIGMIQQCEQDLGGLSEDQTKMQYLDVLISLANSLEKVRPVILAIREEVIRDIIERRNISLALEDRFYSINDVAQKLGCHRTTVYNKHLKNGLRSVDMGKRDKKVKASDLNAYIQSIESK